jgi:hypothetical protein
MGVDHRCFHVLVSEQFLHRADVIAAFEQVSGEEVLEGVGLTGLLMPASLAAFLTALCTALSWRW